MLIFMHMTRVLAISCMLITHINYNNYYTCSIHQFLVVQVDPRLPVDLPILAILLHLLILLFLLFLLGPKESNAT